VLRAIGDTAGDGGAAWARWLSPIGWGQQVRPYQGDRYWVLLLPIAFFVVGTVLAGALLARRDHGAGLLRERPGPANARAGLGHALGLAWRLQRGALAGWTVGFVLIGLVFGNVATNIGDFLGSPNARELIQKLGGVEVLTDAFMSTELGMAGIIASVFGIQAVLRLRSEESELRAEPVLATKVGRLAWAWSHIAIALLGTTVLLAAAGVGAGIAYSAQTGAANDFWRVLAAALVRLPAAWVLTGITVAAFGFLPRAAVLGWVALVGFLVLGEFGPLFGLDQWVMNLSPYAHVPRLPGGSFTAVPVAWLLLTAAAFVVAGLIGLRRRDMPVT
jgi:ABC-2 type transport system permease protein